MVMNCLACRGGDYLLVCVQLFKNDKVQGHFGAWFYYIIAVLCGVLALFGR